MRRSTAIPTPRSIHRPVEEMAEADSATSVQSLEQTANRAFQVYSEHVTATARSLQETPTQELHRHHDKAAKARRGSEHGAKTRLK